jgi:GTP-binding protein EngB required for normal cell division
MEEQKSQERCVSMIMLGQPGVGKSTVCNYLIDGNNSNRFRSSQESVGGFTREIQVAENNALGDPTRKLLKVIDLPGFGDPTLDINTMALQLKE